MVATTPYTKLIDGVSKSRDAVDLPGHIPAASDDYVWRGDDGLPIYSVVAQAAGRDCAATVYQTRSLDDALQRLGGLKGLQEDGKLQASAIRVGGVSLLTDADLDQLSKRKPVPPPSFLTWDDLGEIIRRDKERWATKDPAVNIGFGAELDVQHRVVNEPRQVGDVPLSPAMEAILRTAERRGMQPHEINRLSDFAAFARVAGASASEEDVQKAWQKTIRTSPDPDELAAAWEKRKQEMLEDAKAAVKKTVQTAKSMVAGIWDTLTAHAPASDRDTPRDMMGYASALLDASKSMPKEMAKKMPEYMNAYTRGEVLGDHLFFDEKTLPKNVSDVLRPVLHGNDPNPQGWVTHYRLSANEVFDAMNAVKNQGGSSLIHDGKVIDVAEAFRMREQAMALRSSDLTPEKAQKAGEAMYRLLSIVGPGSEQDVLQRLKIDGKSLSSVGRGFDVRGAVADGFEDALRQDRSSGGPRITTFLKALDDTILKSGAAMFKKAIEIQPEQPEQPEKTVKASQPDSAPVLNKDVDTEKKKPTPEEVADLLLQGHRVDWAAFWSDSADARQSGNEQQAAFNKILKAYAGIGEDHALLATAIKAKVDNSGSSPRKINLPEHLQAIMTQAEQITTLGQKPQPAPEPAQEAKPASQPAPEAAPEAKPLRMADLVSAMGDAESDDDMGEGLLELPDDEFDVEGPEL